MRRCAHLVLCDETVPGEPVTLCTVDARMIQHVSRSVAMDLVVLLACTFL